MKDINNNELVRSILNTLESHRRVFAFISEEKLNDQTSDIIDRLKMQRNLFIKEICRVFNIDRAKHFDGASSYISDRVEEIRNIVNEGKADTDQYVNLAMKLEQSLESDYDSLIYYHKLGEIALMILKNQLNEIRRDSYLLENQLENNFSASV